MRRLYLPHSERREEATPVLDRYVQSATRTTPGSSQYALASAIMSVLSRTRDEITRLDVRPHASDVRAPGALKEGSGEEVPFEELLYGVPHRWRLAERRTYSPSESFDRAIETPDGLLLQDGDRILRVLSGETEEINPLNEGVFGTGTMVSVTEDTWRLLESGDPEKHEVAVTIDGLRLVFGGSGFFEGTMQFVSIESVSSGDTLSDLPFFAEAGRLDRNGETISYTIENGEILFEGADALLYYTAEWPFTYEPTVPSKPLHARKDARLSFSPAAEVAYRMPEASSVSCYQSTDLLCHAPGGLPVDRQGLVGETYVGHPIDAVLFGEHHAIVAGPHQVTLVDYLEERIRLTQRFPDLTICGVTWTQESELGLIAEESGTCTVFALQDDRTQLSSGGLTIA